MRYRCLLTMSLTSCVFIMVLSGCFPAFDRDEGIEMTAENDAAVMGLFTRNWIAATEDGSVFLSLQEDTAMAEEVSTCTEVAHVVMGADRAEDDVIGQSTFGLGGCYAEPVYGYLTGTISGGPFEDEVAISGTFVLAYTDAQYDDIYALPYDIRLAMDDSRVDLGGVMEAEDQLQLNIFGSTHLFAPDSL